MPRFDLSPTELATYAPEVREPADFDDFWDAAVAASRQWDAAPEVTLLATPYTLVDVFDVTFSGYGGQPIKGWLQLPKHLLRLQAALRGRIPWLWRRAWLRHPTGSLWG